MKAAVYYGPGDVKVEDVPEPVAGPGQVKLRVAYNGICGSDLHEYYGQPMMVPIEPHPLTGVKAPVILGHECGGHVVDVGPGVTGFEAGDLVAVEPIIRCGQCRWCRSGQYNHCSLLAFHGFSAGGGGLAEYTVVDDLMLHKLPSSFSPEQAALIEPLAVSYHAVRRARLEPGQTAVVHGAGPIGLGAIFALQALGVEVIVSEPAADRRAILDRLGVKQVIDPSQDDVVAAIMDLTDGAGASATIDAAGVPAVLDTALLTTTNHGTIVLVAIPQQNVQFMGALLFMTELDLRASTAYCDDFPRVIDAMAAGAYPLDGWISKIALADVVEQGLEVLHQGGGMKILVDPTPA